MQATSAPKDSDEPDSSGLNWRQRKKAVALRNEGNVRRQQLTEGYIAALGGVVNAMQLEDVERAVDLVMLARGMRAKALRGEAKVRELSQLEVAADKAVRRLNLPAPNAAPVRTLLADYLAAGDGEG